MTLPLKKLKIHHRIWVVSHKMRLRCVPVLPVPPPVSAAPDSHPVVLSLSAGVVKLPGVNVTQPISFAVCTEPPDAERMLKFKWRSATFRTTCSLPCYTNHLHNWLTIVTANTWWIIMARKAPSSSFPSAAGGNKALENPGQQSCGFFSFQRLSAGCHFWRWLCG